MGPTIFNFTGIQISKDLTQLLKNGLNDVLEIATPKEELLFELQQEIIIATINIFFSNYGFYPLIAKDTLDKTILSILAQCT